MDGLFRRGGVWYARIVVPQPLRLVIGKTELVASTGVREPALARVVASELLAGWRRRLLDLSRTLGSPMDIELITLGHPALSGGGYLPLAEAVTASGIDEPYFLRQAADGNLSLYFRCAAVSGHLCSIDEFDRDIGPDGITLLVPSPAQMSEMAVPIDFSGVLRLRDVRACAIKFASGASQGCVLFDLPDQPDRLFAPLRAVDLISSNLELAVDDVDRTRRAFALTVTPAQLEASKAAKVTTDLKANPKSVQRLSEVVDAYMIIRAMKCNPEQARRVRGALDLLVEMEGDPRLCDVDSDRMERFRNEKLVTVPARENKIRLQHKTSSITESIQAVAGTDWPSISVQEQVRRLKFIAGMFDWAVAKRWLEHDPCTLLVRESQAAAASRVEASKNRDQDARNLFTREELKAIFSFGPWFSTGRGELTAEGTYREFSPHYYWLPLLGLLTGGRINELSQLFLQDIKRTETGTWYYDIAWLDDPRGRKKRKNSNSKRSVPVHPMLIKLGLIDWRDRLRAAGYERLFPELKYNETKGFGKASSKWFSSYLKRLGWERNGRKTFHSFRATLLSECVQRLKLSVTETAQISGHARDISGAINGYIKDQSVDELLPKVTRLDFDLPHIATFDSDAGLHAVTDAMNRKNRGTGATEDC